MTEPFRVVCAACGKDFFPLSNGLVRFHYYHYFNGNQMSTRCRGSGSVPERTVTVSDAEQKAAELAAESPMQAYNRGKSDVKQKEPKYDNPYAEGTVQNTEYTRGYRENIGY